VRLADALLFHDTAPHLIDNDIRLFLKRELSELASWNDWTAGQRPPSWISCVQGRRHLRDIRRRNRQFPGSQTHTTQRTIRLIAELTDDTDPRGNSGGSPWGIEFGFPV